MQLTADYPGFFMHRRMICENDSFARNRGLTFTGKSQKSMFCPYPGSYFYGQITEIDVLPVTEGCFLRANLRNRRFARIRGCLLRANHRNRRFARNRRPAFTGKSQKSPFCPYPGADFYGQIPEIAFLPVTKGCLLRANPRNRRFARKPILILTHDQQALRSTAFIKNGRNLMPNAIIRPEPPSEKIFSKKQYFTLVLYHKCDIIKNVEVRSNENRHQSLLVRQEIDDLQSGKEVGLRVHHPA